MLNGLTSIHRALQPGGKVSSTIPCLSLRISEENSLGGHLTVLWLIEAPRGMQIFQMNSVTCHLGLHPQDRLCALAQIVDFRVEKEGQLHTDLGIQ